MFLTFTRIPSADHLPGERETCLFDPRLPVTTCKFVNKFPGSPRQQWTWKLVFDFRYGLGAVPGGQQTHDMVSDLLVNAISMEGETPGYAFSSSDMRLR